MTFAGAWTNYGFHEDGFTSGLKIATDYFNASPPFPIRPASREIHKEPLARAIVMQLELARAWAERSVVWGWVVQFVLMFWVALERVLRGAGMEAGAREVKAVRGFWEDQ